MSYENLLEKLHKLKSEGIIQINFIDSEDEKNETKNSKNRKGAKLHEFK